MQIVSKISQSCAQITFMRDCEVIIAVVIDQLLSNINVQNERVHSKVNHVVILVDPNGVLGWRDQEVPVYSMSAWAFRGGNND